MDRPTCKTCPYYQEIWSEDEDDGFGVGAGSCHLNPPRLLRKEDRENPVDCISPEYWQMPTVTEDNFCASHPSFPAYLASLKAAPRPPDPPVYDSIPEGAYVIEGVPEGFPLRRLGEDPG